jgi:hypothetical protein
MFLTRIFILEPRFWPSIHPTASNSLGRIRGVTITGDGCFLRAKIALVLPVVLSGTLILQSDQQLRCLKCLRDAVVRRSVEIEG